MTSPNRVQEVEAVIEQYRTGFATLDGNALARIWDRTYDGLVYVALEEPAARRTWESIADYYAKLQAGPDVRAVAMNLHDLSVNVLGDVAHAFCRFEFIGEDGEEERFVIEGRSSFVLRHHDGAWRLIHYHESAPRQVGES